MTEKTATSDEWETLISPFYAKMQNLIPRHKEIFENYKIKVNMLITQGYIHELQRETKEKMESIKELEAFKLELSHLRSKISKTNQHMIDTKFEKHKTSINEILQGYSKHMEIINDILISKRKQESGQVKAELVRDSSSSFDRFPKTISEFEKYKDEFLKYDALHEFINDDFLYDVMKELASGKESVTQKNEIDQGNQLGGSSFSGYETETNNLKSEASVPLVRNINDEM